MTPSAAATLFPIRLPVRVLSDLHLGHPASYLHEPQMLRPLFAGCRTVVFNGDTCELSNVQRHQEATDKLERLAGVCRAEGARALFITGNHDPHISTAHWLELLDGRVFVTHGDVLHPRIAPWSREAPVLWAERCRLLAGRPEPTTLEELTLLTKRCNRLTAIYDLDAGRGALARLAMVARFAGEPWRIPRVLAYWFTIARRARRFLAQFRPAARLLVFGHTHRAAIHAARSCTLINTGSYQPLSTPLVAHIDEPGALVYEVVARAGTYHLGRKLRDCPL